MTLRPEDSLWIVWAKSVDGREVTETVVAASVEEAIEAARIEWADVFHLHTVAGPQGLAMT